MATALGKGRGSERIKREQGRSYTGRVERERGEREGGWECIANIMCVCVERGRERGESSGIRRCFVVGGLRTQCTMVVRVYWIEFTMI